MKARILTLALLIIAISLAAEGWKLDSNATVTLSQNAYSDSWQGKENSNITWVANSTSTAEKQITGWLQNKNTLKLAFGQTHNQRRNSQNEKYWEHAEKSTDKIDFEAMLRFTTHGWVDPFIAQRIESQFLDQKADETLVFNPLLFTETAGIIRSFFNEEHRELSLRLGAAFREKLDRGVIGASGDKETATTVDGGLELVSEYKRKLQIPLSMDFRSRMQVYQALFNSKEDELPNDDWKSPDLVWENTLSTKLWGALSANLIFELRYDKEEIHEVQWKEILGLGLSYSLF
ncbi:MAG: hypothetical protein PHC50_10415 [Candidatus Cloacimonetes bacterium]|nr:hypothetical protein [Candidatus Cloacimonadota bacterium]